MAKKWGTTAKNAKSIKELEEFIEQLKNVVVEREMTIEELKAEAEEAARAHAEETAMIKAQAEAELGTTSS